MITAKDRFKLGALVILSMICSIFPFLMAAPFTRIAYHQFSRASYWSFFGLAVLLLASFGAVSISISLAGVVILVGIFSGLLKRSNRLFISGFIAIMCSFLTTLIATKQWLIHQGTSLSAKLEEQVHLLIQQAQSVKPAIKLESDFLVGQAPSMLVALLLMSLALALILEGPLTRLFGFSEPTAYSKVELLGFRAPDSYIWIGMVSFLLSFLNLGSRELSLFATNVVNIVVVVYFFQGLAVIESFFTALKFGFFIRFMTYVVFLLQLFFLVAAIGVIDFWVEFRKRFIRIQINS